MVADPAEIGTIAAVGYNPFRKQVKRRSDVVFVAAAVAVVVLAVVWAFMG